MAREWQQTKCSEYVMPEPVFYQSIWAVRDLRRMEKRLEEIKREELSAGQSIVRELFRGGSYDDVDPTQKRAMERLILEERIEAIYKALAIVPEMYRPYVIGNIVLKDNKMNYPNKLWRIWKQRFLFHVAKNLSLM